MHTSFCPSWLASFLDRIRLIRTSATSTSLCIHYHRCKAWNIDSSCDMAYLNERTTEERLALLCYFSVECCNNMEL